MANGRNQVQGAVRIVGGELRGRVLFAPRGDIVRPTADRIRESVFNILANRLEFSGIRVIDLFAGSGALGLEALSRGAAFALFVDNSAEGALLIRRNIDALGLNERAGLSKRDAILPGAAKGEAPFDLAFLDPPYGRGLGEKAASALAAAGLLKVGALLVLEEERNSLPAELSGFERFDRREFGGTAIGLFRVK